MNIRLKAAVTALVLTGATNCKTQNETSDVQFFDPNDIPPLSIGRTLPHQIKRFYEQCRNTDDLATDFD